MLKMIKQSNLGDADKLHLTLHEADSLHLENCSIMWRTENFYRIKNKERGIKLGCRVGMAFGDWLSGYAAFLVKCNSYRDAKVL